MAAQRHDVTTSIGLLVLRIGVGVLMLTHGWGKVQMLFGDPPPAPFDPIGLGQTTSLALAALGEFVGSLLVVLGLLTRVGALLVVATMAVAAFVVHANDPWLMSGGAAKEPALIFLTAFLTLVFTGAGRYSLDAKRGAHRHS